MSFALKLDAMPEPITVEFDGQSFKLIHMYMTAEERAEAIYALGSIGPQGACELLYKKIISWEGVTDMDGSPIAMQKANREGEITHSVLSVVMGRIPWHVQLLAMFKQFALNGVTLAKIKDALTAFVHDKAELESIEESMNDFLKRRSAKPGDKSKD